jgi:hypothetical protein
MNKDLSKIKKRYHEIWTTDWNKGGESKLNYQERYRISELWKEFNKNDLFNPEINYIY